MFRHNNQRLSPLVKIVYTKVRENGKFELVPVEVYADGSFERLVNYPSLYA